MRNITLGPSEKSKPHLSPLILTPSWVTYRQVLFVSFRDGCASFWGLRARTNKKVLNKMKVSNTSKQNSSPLQVSFQMIGHAKSEASNSKEKFHCHLQVLVVDFNLDLVDRFSFAFACLHIHENNHPSRISWVSVEVYSYQLLKKWR